MCNRLQFFIFCSSSLKKSQISSLKTSSRLFIHDSVLQLNFVIDIGAYISVIPEHHIRPSPSKSEFTLYAATKLMRLSLNTKRSYTWIFLIADTSQAIIGTDFLKHYNLSVNLKSKFLFDHTLNSEFHDKIEASNNHSIFTYFTLLQEDE